MKAKVVKTNLSMQVSGMQTKKHAKAARHPGKIKSKFKEANAEEPEGYEVIASLIGAPSFPSLPHFETH